MLLDEHPGAEAKIVQITIDGLSAYRIRLRYADVHPMTEEIVIAYRRPKNPSDEPGVIYELGLKCRDDAYSANVSLLDVFVASFWQTAD